MDLDSYLAKRILPKIMAYRKKYIEHEIPGWPLLLSKNPQLFPHGVLNPEDDEKARQIHILSNRCLSRKNARKKVLNYSESFLPVSGGEKYI